MEPSEIMTFMRKSTKEPNEREGPNWDDGKSTLPQLHEHRTSNKHIIVYIGKI